MSKKKRRRRLVPSVQCRATNRWGEPCKAWAMKGSVVCVKHGGMAPQVRKKAQERIMMAQDDAASLLVQFMGDDEVPFAERRRAAEFLLNYEHRNDVNVTLQPWEQALVSGVIYDYTEVSDSVIDVEVIEEKPRPAILPSDHEAKTANILDDPPRYTRAGPRRRDQ